jgi:hypothetical protein
VLKKYKKEIRNLQKEKIRLEVLMSNGRYEKVRHIVEKEINNLISKRRDLLKLAVVSILESIRQDLLFIPTIWYTLSFKCYGIL